MARLSLVILCLFAVAAAPPSRIDKGAGKSAHQSRGEWEIFFDEEITLEEYARQMDYFQIEIAAVSKNGKIEYISKVSQRKPEKRVGHTSAEYRLHIGWKKGPLHAADRKLLTRAGIASADKELWHFFEAKTQAQLAALERAYAGRPASEITRTQFEIRPVADGEGYEFVVTEQDPPKPIKSESAGAASANRPDRNPR
jgi:hypothetical protein